MTTIWFVILCAMVAVYAVLDGFDLGVGSLLLILTRNESERHAALEAIGPVWNGNEVWLLSAGGAMVAAFPGLYAAGFSGFYLPLMLVLWLFILRGIGYEFRHFEKSEMWTGAADVGFSVASLLLALLFGVAVGNVLRGVPMDASGQFTGAFAFLLNPFALVAGLMSVAILGMHGAAYIALRTDELLQEKATRFVGVLWAVSTVLTAVLVGASFFVRPDFLTNYLRWPVLWILPVVAVAAIATVPIMVRNRNSGGMFAGTTGIILGLLGSAAAGMYPTMLPALHGTSGLSLNIYNTAAGPHSLFTALCANVIGMSIVTCYMVYIYRTVHSKRPVVS